MDNMVALIWNVLEHLQHLRWANATREALALKSTNALVFHAKGFAL